MAEEKKVQARPSGQKQPGGAPPTAAPRAMGRFQVRVLEEWRQKNTMLEFELFEGKRLFGQIQWYDEFTIGIKGGASLADVSRFKEIILFKQALVTIKPAG